MKYIELQELFKDFGIFSLSDIRKVEPGFHRQRLTEWQKKGYIRKAVAEHYLFSNTQVDERLLFLIANRIYAPSYISLEMAFWYHGLIPEGVYTVTSVTSRTTRVLHSDIAVFSYRKIKRELFFGYVLLPYRNSNIRMAELEKAILDYLYLNTRISTDRDFYELRIQREILSEKIDVGRFKRYLNQYRSRALEERAERFLRYHISHYA